MIESDDLDNIFDVLKDTNSFPFFGLTICFLIVIFVIFLFIFAANQNKKYYHRRDIFFENTSIPTRVDVDDKYWVFRCFFWTSEQIYTRLGIDSMVFLKTIRMFLAISIIVCFICLAGPLPIHLMQSGQDQPLFFRSSLSMVSENYKLLWVHFLLIYLISGIIMVFLYFNWKDVTKYRQRYFKSDPFNISSLLFSDLNLPCENEKRDNSLSHKIRQIASESEQIVEYTLRDITKLQKIIEKHDALILNYTTEEDTVSDRNGLLVGDNINIFSSKASSIPIYNETILNNYEEILQYAETVNHALVPATIVAVSNIGLAQTFRCTSFSIKNTVIRISLLPEPTAIIWHNLGLERSIRFLNGWVISLLTALVIIFCSLPFVLVAAITKSITISDKHLVNIKSNIIKTMLQYLVNTLVPIVLVNVFLLMERLIFQKLSTYENHVSYKDADFSVLKKMCIFNALDTFFAFTFTTTIIDLAITLIEKPLEISVALATSIPVQYNFFMIYLAFQTFLMMPWYLLRGNHYVYTKIMRFIHWARQIRKRTKDKKVYKPQIKPLDSEYVYKYSNIILIFGIGLVFSLLAPLITLVWIPFFVVGHIFYSFEEERNNVNTYTYGGEFWPIISDCVAAYLVFMQIIMIGMFSIKNFTILSFLTIPACFLTVYFARKLKTTFYTTFYYPTYDTMKDIKPISLVEMHTRCKPYYVESFIPSKTGTSSDRMWEYVMKREMRFFSATI